MMVEVRQNGGEGEVADGHASFVRLADASARLFAEQAAALAVLTAFGMSVAGQMTGMMLGALRTTEANGPDALPAVEPAAGAVDASSKVETESKVVHLRPKSEKPASAAKTKLKMESAKAMPKAKAAKVIPKAEMAQSAPEAGAMLAPAGDDLKRISGIGPRLEKVLNGRGIRSYMQIAGLSSAALTAIDDELDLDGRVMRDDWASQARALAAGRA